MFQRMKLIALALGAALLLAGCSARVRESDLTGKTYVYEKPGFGGEFTICLEEGSEFTYHEGGLSSYIGAGAWELDGDILTLTDETGLDFTNRFQVVGGDLVFRSEGSTNFIHLEVADGERFSERLPE